MILYLGSLSIGKLSIGNLSLGITDEMIFDNISEGLHSEQEHLHKSAVKSDVAYLMASSAT